MEAGDEADRAPIELLGKWVVDGLGSQTGFDVAKRNAAVERPEPGHKRGRRVALSEHHGRLQAVEKAVQALHRAAGHLRQGLALLHDVQVFVRREAERREGTQKDFPVLTGGNQKRLHGVVLAELLHNGGNFNRFRPRADNTNHERLRHTNELWRESPRQG